MERVSVEWLVHLHLHLHLRLPHPVPVGALRSAPSFRNSMVTASRGGALEPLEPIAGAESLLLWPDWPSVVRPLIIGAAARMRPGLQRHLDECGPGLGEPRLDARSRGPRRSRPSGPARPCPGPASQKSSSGSVRSSSRRAMRPAGVGTHPVQLHVQDGVAPVGQHDRGHVELPRGPGSTGPATCTWRSRPPAGRAPAARVRPPPRPVRHGEPDSRWRRRSASASRGRARRRSRRRRTGPTCCPRRRRSRPRGAVAPIGGRHRLRRERGPSGARARRRRRAARVRRRASCVGQRLSAPARVLAGTSQRVHGAARAGPGRSPCRGRRRTTPGTWRRPGPGARTPSSWAWAISAR